MGMTKEQFEKYIFSARDEKSKNEVSDSAYDLAGRKCCLALYDFFKRHPKINIEDVYYEDDSKGRKIQINSVLDNQAKVEIKSIRPTGFMFGYALGLQDTY